MKRFANSVSVVGSPSDETKRRADTRKEAARLRALSRETRAQSLRLRLEAQRLHKVSLHDLIPLDLAVRVIFRTVYEEQVGQFFSSRDGAHLDGLGYAVASLRTIYTYQIDGKGLRPLAKEEISTGLFRGGAKEMYFVDGRPPLVRLALAASEVHAIAKALKMQLPLDGLESRNEQRGEVFRERP